MAYANREGSYQPEHQCHLILFYVHNFRPKIKMLYIVCIRPFFFSSECICSFVNMELRGVGMQRETTLVTCFLSGH